MRLKSNADLTATLEGVLKQDSLNDRYSELSNRDYYFLILFFSEYCHFNIDYPLVYRLVVLPTSPLSPLSTARSDFAVTLLTSLFVGHRGLASYRVFYTVSCCFRGCGFALYERGYLHRLELYCFRSFLLGYQLVEYEKSIRTVGDSGLIII